MYKGLHADDSNECPSTLTTCHRIPVEVAETKEHVQGKDGHDFV